MINPTILVADDDAEIRKVVSLSLELEGFAVESVSSGEQALERLQGTPAPSLVILDLIMPGIGGMETLRRLRQLPRKPPVMVFTCLDTPDIIVEAMQAGASDYLMKPFENDNLQRRVNRLLNGKAVKAAPIVGQFVAQNAQMLKIQETIAQIAHTDVPVLIHGESGVGKEVVARAIHEASGRRDKPFVKINCAALPSTLLESEMFGYERGAFTGAFNAKPGKFELAHTGTIFLDEISEMEPALQAKFLQVLQDSRFSRLGGKSVVQVDARVLAATNMNLKQALKSGAFREDLYYRLSVVDINVPPLRERLDDLEPLIVFFCEKYGPQYGHFQMPSGRLLQAMRQYDWPGNVRELENVIRRYLVLADPDLVARELENTSQESFSAAAPAAALQEDGSVTPFTERFNDYKNKAEVQAINKALNRTNWNRKEAAKLLNIGYKSLLYRMKVLKIGVQ